MDENELVTPDIEAFDPHEAIISTQQTFDFDEALKQAQASQKCKFERHGPYIICTTCASHHTSWVGIAGKDDVIYKQ